MDNFKKAMRFVGKNLRHGDRTKIQQRTGYSQPVVTAALKKKNADHLTEAEENIIAVAIDIARENRMATINLINQIEGL